MRSILSAVVTALLAVSIVASPAADVKQRKRDTCKKKTCKKDGCLLALIPLLPAPLQSLAKSDCSSYFKTTITPTPTTSTQTLTKTVANSATTSVVLVTVSTPYYTMSEFTAAPYTRTFTKTQITVVETDEATVTETAVVPVTVLNTVVETDVAATSTIYLPKRVVPPLRVPNVNASSGGLAERAAAANKYIPAYASACAGPTFYSSACSCLGVTHSTVTATRSTVVVTATATVQKTIPAYTVTRTVVQSVVVTTVLPSSQEIDVTVTQQIPSTFTTTDATLIFNVPTTIVNTVTVTTTVTPLRDCSFQLQVVGGTSSGSLIQNQGQNAFAVFSGTGTLYHLDASGQVVSGDQIWNVDAASYSFIDVDSESSIESDGFARLSCSIAADQTFTCTSSNGLNTFYSCGGSFEAYPEISTSVPNGCTGFTFKALPMC